MEEIPHLLNVQYLPKVRDLPVGKLERVFSKTTTTYKYYWFLSILEILHERALQSSSIRTTLTYEEIIRKMLSLAWYPINMFHIHFGKSDNLGNLLQSLRNLMETENIVVKANSSDKEIESKIKKLIQSNHGGIQTKYKEILSSLEKYVIYRFLSPWVEDELGYNTLSDYQKNGFIRDKTNQQSFFSTKLPMYQIQVENREIRIHPQWIGYLIQFYNILRDFTIWNLLDYLQKRNPGVPNLSQKLFKPEKRSLERAQKFWKLFQAQFPNEIFYSIYTGQTLKTAYDIDHFLPWSFVAHDYLWNTIPAEKEINIQKSDRLPNLEKYFEPFSNMQYKAACFAFSLYTKSKAKYYLDYYNAFYPVEMKTTLPLEELFAGNKLPIFQEALAEYIKPQWELAKQYGFSEWR